MTLVTYEPKGPALEFVGHAGAGLYGQDPVCAELARQHNDANVLCLGGKLIGPVLAMAVVKTWMETDPLTDEKYVRRRDKVFEIDAERTTEVE